MNPRSTKLLKSRKNTRRSRRKARPLAIQYWGPLLCLLVLLIAPAEAGARSDRNGLSNVITQFCGDRYGACIGHTEAKTQRAQTRRAARRMQIDKMQQYVKPERSTDKLVTREAHDRGVSLAGIVSPLASKAREIMADCGSKVISALRRGARIPTGQMSNHAVGRAVDMQGNPECIYAHLKGWPGGYSTDYHTAPGGKHVHISYNPGGMEWGVRFAHRGGWPRKVSAAMQRHVSNAD